LIFCTKQIERVLIADSEKLQESRKKFKLLSAMKKLHFKMEEFLEFELTQVSMNKLRGGDSPANPDDPPVPPTGK
jgi:hypothetical protein